jgi:hypothetical protein
VDHPCDVPQKINVPRVADAQASARAVPVQLSLVDDFAQRRRIKQSA